MSRGELMSGCAGSVVSPWLFFDGLAVSNRSVDEPSKRQAGQPDDYYVAYPDLAESAVAQEIEGPGPGENDALDAVL